jgi:hypothetical protein
MARYRIENTVVDTDKASAYWDEAVDRDGHNQISRATRSQWGHQELYRSRRGRYYVVHTSQWQGSQAHAEWVSPEEACRWLLLMGHPIPQDLQAAVDTVSD